MRPARRNRCSTRNIRIRAAQFGVLTAADRPPASAWQRASDRIIETLMKSPVKMTLIPVGPLTNIALALKEEPRIKGLNSYCTS